MGLLKREEQLERPKLPRVYCECGGCIITVHDGDDFERLSSGGAPTLRLGSNPTISTDGDCAAALVNEKTGKLVATTA